MSKKTEKPKLPVIVESEVESEIPSGLNLYLCSFTWNKKVFVNIETGAKTKIKMWTKGGNVWLSPVLKNGRHILSHIKIPKHIVNKKGEIVETRMVNKTKIVGREFGYKALSSILSAIYPCSTERAKELVKEALDKQIAHAKLVLKSDLVPTSPQRYEGKNEWVCIADYPSSDQIQADINKVLKAQGSPLRARFGLKWRLQE